MCLPHADDPYAQHRCIFFFVKPAQVLMIRGLLLEALTVSGMRQGDDVWQAAAAVLLCSRR
jgi:hypothetical protein